MAGYMVYLKWKIRKKWMREASGAGGSLTLPYRYASNHERFKPKKDDTVWVVACPRWDQDRLPPTLEARFELVKGFVNLDTAENLDPLDRLFQRFGRYLAVSDEDHGGYFPINNLYKTLLELEFQPHKPISDCPRCTHKVTSPADSLYAHIPTHLQMVRYLTGQDEVSLRDYARSVERQKIFFLSYRHGENDELVRAFAHELECKGVAYWLDNEMIRYRAEKEADWLPDERLAQLLSDAIRQSYTFVSFVSQTYLERDWVRFELEKAKTFLDEGHLGKVVAIHTHRLREDLSLPTEDWELFPVAEGDRLRVVREIAQSLLS